MDSFSNSYLWKTLSKGERTRLRILEQAVECFARNGFEGTSFSELAKTANVNRALFSHYFKSKEKLIDECIRFVVASGQDAVKDKLSGSPRDSDPITLYVEANFLWLKDRREYARFLVLAIQRASYDSMARKEIEKTFTAAREGLERLLAQLCKIKKGKCDSIPVLAMQIHELVVGAMILLLIDPRSDVAVARERCAKAAQALIRGSLISSRP